nr:unnamed protein product [Spirometra erinaceieuropaei]
MKPTASRPPKSNSKRANHSCTNLAMPSTTDSNVSSVSMDIPGTNRTCWTPSDPLRLSNRTKCRPSSSSPPPANSDRSSEPPFPSSSSTSCSSSSSSSSSPSAAPTRAVVTPAMHIPTAHNPDTSSNITIAIVDTRGDDQDYTCPLCDRIFASHIGLVGHLRIHRTVTDKPVPGAPAYSHRIRLHCSHCPRTFTHRMGLFVNILIHEILR